jgi:hypothetical protein
MFVFYWENTTRTGGSLFGFCIFLEPPLGKSKCILIICDYGIIIQYDGYKYIHMYIYICICIYIYCNIYIQYLGTCGTYTKYNLENGCEIKHFEAVYGIYGK